MGGTGFLQMINQILLYFSFYSSANSSFSKNNIIARLASVCNPQHFIIIAVCKYTAPRYLGGKSQPTFKVNSFLKVACWSILISTPYDGMKWRCPGSVIDRGQTMSPSASCSVIGRASQDLVSDWSRQRRSGGDRGFCRWR